MFDDASPELLATLEHERDRMTQRIECLERNRDTVSAYLAEIRRRNNGADGAVPSWR